jgi:hypothetical protein
LILDAAIAFVFVMLIVKISELVTEPFAQFCTVLLESSNQKDFFQPIRGKGHTSAIRTEISFEKGDGA